MNVESRQIGSLVADSADKCAQAVVVAIGDVHQLVREDADHSLVGTQAGEIVDNLERADRRMAARVGETAEVLANRAMEIGRVFEAADRQIAARVGETAETLSAKAAETADNALADDEDLDIDDDGDSPDNDVDLGGDDDLGVGVSDDDGDDN